MKKKFLWRLSAPVVTAILLLGACSSATPTAPAENTPDKSRENTHALLWNTFGSYANLEEFLDLVGETYPEIDLEIVSYNGANRTGYSWAQMRADDIPDIFITSQVTDRKLAKERLVDLSNYPFVNDFSDATLNQMDIEGGIYLLPVTYTMYGIYYNKTLMEEKGWEVPSDFAELEALCEEIQAEGLIPGIIGTEIPNNTFSAVFNLAKTGWLTTPAGSEWEQDFLAGNATAQGMWEPTMDYVQKYIDIGMFRTDPEDRHNRILLEDYLGGRKAVFLTSIFATPYTAFDNGDELGMMPYISEDGSKNIYMYSPSYYFGISKRLTETGNEQKLEDALKIISLLFSEKGQAAFLGDDAPCIMSALSSNVVPEDSLIYEAQQAMRDGRAFQMTFTQWESILADIGLTFKDWFRGGSDMDGAGSIARMDELQQAARISADQIYFCESTANFTQEETARLVAKALGSSVGADAVLISLSEFHEGGEENRAGISGRLYAEKIFTDLVNTITPGYEGEYAIMTMTGAEAKALEQAGFDLFGNGNTFPYLLVTRGDAELADGETYQVAFPMNGYTEETAQTYSAQVETGSLRAMVRTYLEEQGTVSPDGNPWE